MIRVRHEHRWTLIAATLLMGACGGLPPDDPLEGGEGIAQREQAVTYLGSQHLLGQSLPSLLRQRNSDQCLGVENASYRDGARIVLMRCNKNMTSQKWIAEVYHVRRRGVPQLVYNNQIVFRNAYTHKCIDGGTTRPQQYSCHRGPVQQWRSWYMSSYGTYYENVHNGRRLATGSQIYHELSPAMGLWDDLEVRYHDNNECIDVPYASTGSYQSLQTYPCHGNDNQRIRLQQAAPALSTPYPDATVFTLKLRHSWKCLEAWDQPSGGARWTFQNGCNSSNDYQKWTLVFDLQYGRYHIFNAVPNWTQASLYDDGSWLRTGPPPHGAGLWTLRKR